MKKKRNKSTKILRRYLDGKCDPEERTLVENIYGKLTSHKDFRENITIDIERIGLESWNDIYDIINRREAKRIRLKQYFTAVASVTLIIVLMYGYHSKLNTSLSSARISGERRSDAGVTLVLGNGKKISVENIDTGKITKEPGVDLRKAGKDMLVYKDDASSISNSVVYNTLETFRGKRYTLKLQDGTLVKLNASSSLKYPTVFLGKERIVELKGEAYFEVAHNSKMPFKVRLNGQEITDIGTHFNVNAYPEEENIKTTLLEGAVRVSTTRQNIILQPGQQSVFRRGYIQVLNADTSQVMAWSNGYFKFKNDNIYTVMRQLSRWYNINVYYDSTVPKVTFGALLSRENSISQILDLLESTGKVHFRRAGNDVHVIP